MIRSNCWIHQIIHWFYRSHHHSWRSQMNQWSITRRLARSHLTLLQHRKQFCKPTENLKTQQEYLKVPKRPPGSLPKYQGGWLSADQSWTTTKLAATLSNPTTLKPKHPPNTLQHPQHPYYQELCTLSTGAKCDELCTAPVYKTLTRISAECKLTRASWKVKSKSAFGFVILHTPNIKVVVSPIIKFSVFELCQKKRVCISNNTQV